MKQENIKQESTKKKRHSIEEFMEMNASEEVDSQQRANRQRELANWNESLARRHAREYGIELTADHLKVVQLLHHYYLNHGEVRSGRELDKMLADAFKFKGGRRYLHRLFPCGPVAQGMRFAGLPVPAHTEDSGFGTAR